QRTNDDRVQDDAERHREGDLPELLQRYHREHREARRQRHAGRGNGARGLRRRDGDRVGDRPSPRLLPDPPHHEDVVVRAERDQQYPGGERHEVDQAAVAEDVLADTDGQPQGGEYGQHAGGQQVHRREQRPQEQRQQDQRDRHDGQRDAAQVGEDRADGVAGQRGL